MKILFVCLGNICRSPLAEGILLHLNSTHKLGWTIDSAGTANYHVGEAPDRRTIANAATHGVSLQALRARQFSKSDFAVFDYIFVMDKANFKNVISLASNEAEKNKVSLFLEFVNTSSLQEVPDPYYGDSAAFEQVYQLVFTACTKLIEILESSN